MPPLSSLALQILDKFGWDWWARGREEPGCISFLFFLWSLQPQLSVSMAQALPGFCCLCCRFHWVTWIPRCCQDAPPCTRPALRWWQQLPTLLVFPLSAIPCLETPLAQDLFKQFPVLDFIYLKCRVWLLFPWITLDWEWLCYLFLQFSETPHPSSFSLSNTVFACFLSCFLLNCLCLWRRSCHRPYTNKVLSVLKCQNFLLYKYLRCKPVKQWHHPSPAVQYCHQKSLVMVLEEKRKGCDGSESTWLCFHHGVCIPSACVKQQKGCAVLLQSNEGG